jgi:hypothetical protein
LCFPQQTNLIAEVKVKKTLTLKQINDINSVPTAKIPLTRAMNNAIKFDYLKA